MRLSLTIKSLVAALALALSALASAQDVRPSLQDSFRLGSGTGLLCRVQSRLTDPALSGMFDRAYAIVCRDAAAPVGNIYALRTGDGDPAQRLARLRAATVRCEAAGRASIEDLGTVETQNCTLADSPVAYSVYRSQSGDTVYIAEGLAGYDSALRLGLRSVVADRVLPGELTIATTELGDATAFARVQAGSLDPDQALAEAYRRNNSGDYAEAAEFFATLLRRTGEDDTSTEHAAEYLINQALQRSNLGQFGAAEAAYAQALAIPSASPTQLRLRRNFRALHLLNQKRFDDALSVLDESLAGSLTDPGTVEGATISTDTALAINSGSEFTRQLGGEESERLTVTERSIILDAQAMQLRGAILRTQERYEEATAALDTSLARLEAIRDGRVRSTARLRAQALNELAVIAESQGDNGAAEGRLRQALALMEAQYPFTIAASASKARLAAFLARRGQSDAALALFAEFVDENRDKATARTGLENQLSAYFELILAEIPENPDLVGDFFEATEILVRPGVANTQAVLARELSGGDDEAARLFRQSTTLARAVERTQVELSQLRSRQSRDEAAQDRISALTAELAELTAQQTATQARLSEYPRFRAVSTQALSLSDLQSTLQPGEAYLKLSEVAGRVYMIMVSSDDAMAYRALIDSETLEARVAGLRETISVVEDGQRLTYPFDVSLAYQLYTELLGSAADRFAGVDHLIFEPDGAMLRLPINLLITQEAGVADYERRFGTAGNDDFDFTGIAWLGRGLDVSTAVSARNFRDSRNLPASRAARQFIGLGENAPPQGRFRQAAFSPLDEAEARCRWPLAVWSNPISARELRTARSLVGEGASEILTGRAFTDTAVVDRDDLDDFRIVHFATHGLVTQPSPECPPDPALVTSFGDDPGSDGLLTFSEIFDLRLNADLVILSACDTASAAGVAASQTAGVQGGTSALDGLVRAFFGAGSRAVIASHWPSPDDFSATERLISGLFEAEAGTAVATAMRNAQTGLMDDPATSHPYYWSGFAIVGDGTRPVIRAN